ncbi:MAG: sulfatase [Prolixibacteraceae bacterium]|nr:sulfatase [Prolixibacteraceae bacterium]
MSKLRTLTSAGLMASVALSGFGSEKIKQDHQQPNIIFFLVDDMGWQDTSVPLWTQKTPFNQLYQTPNMERLAAQGMKFTQAYACTVCSPTRTSLMTGMNAARHRVTNWTLNRNASVDAADKILDFPKWNVNGLQPVDSISRSVYATTLPQLLRANGYFTIHCGKAHWGATKTPGSEPRNLGFDINIAGHAAGGPGSYLGEKNFGNKEKGGYTLPWGIPGLEKYHGDTINLTEALTREAIQALDKSRTTGKPFYLYMSHYAVHAPLEPDHRFYPKYKAMGLPEPEARYASMIESMDKSLGDLMNYLEEKGLTGNTIILFMSDNGGLSAVARGGQLHTHNAPLRSGKGSAYEGGIREPMIVKWPGKVKPALVCNDYLIIEDFFPSILEMAGVKKYKTVQKVDGKSFVPMLTQTGTTASNRDLFWHYPNRWGETGPGIGTTSTVRSGDWKLIYWYKDQTFELYNIANDIEEKNNLAQSEPQKVKELASKLGKYLRSVDAQRPVRKDNQQPVPWPDQL